MQFCSHAANGLAGLQDRQRVTIGGLISSIKHSNVRRARDADAPTRYVMFDLEDFDGSVRCIQWPTEFAKQGELVQPDSIVVIKGTVDRRSGDEANVIVEQIIPLDQMDQSLTSGVCVCVRNSDDPDVLQKIHEIVRGYPGNRKLQLEVDLDNGFRVRSDCHKTKVNIDVEMLDRLKELLGPGAYELIVDSSEPAAAPKPAFRRGAVPVG
jgi:DNA polymerase-3 subunit alpha